MEDPLMRCPNCNSEDTEIREEGEHFNKNGIINLEMICNFCKENYREQYRAEYVCSVMIDIYGDVTEIVIK